MPDPVIHKLVRDGQPAPRLADARQTRADQPYRCTCGERYRSTSRRDARILHAMHRDDTLGGKP